MMRELVRKLKALHRDDQGADMVEYILIVAAIALPVLAVVVWFRKDIVQWINSAWETIKGGQGATPGSEGVAN